jgi:hypothetical protein
MDARKSNNGSLHYFSVFNHCFNDVINMKNLYLSLFAFLFFCRISLAQNYVPLQLDSFHSFYEGISPKSGGLDTQLLLVNLKY